MPVDWRPGRLPLRLTTHQWRALLKWFVRGMPSAQIALETGLDRKRVLRALTIVRRAMKPSMPSNGGESEAELFSGQEWMKRHGSRASQSTRPLRPRFAALGLYTVHGRVRAEVVPDAETEQLGQILRDRKRQPSLETTGLDRYAAVAHRGRLYRFSGAGAATARFGQIEGFWAYLQRQLRSKGGIRRKRLGLYLAEYAWRYNHRKLSSAEQLRELLKLVRETSAGGRNATFPVPREPREHADPQVFHRSTA